MKKGTWFSSQIALLQIKLETKIKQTCKVGQGLQYNLTRYNESNRLTTRESTGQANSKAKGNGENPKL